MNHTLKEYRDAILKIAGNEFRFGVIDGTQLWLCTRNNEIFLNQFNDMVLINENGHQIVGEVLTKK